MSLQSAQREPLPISVAGLRKAFGPVRVLDDVSIDVHAGEFLTLLGPSGSGKTTLLMAMAGFVRPDAGSIRFGTREVVAEPAHKRGVGMVFQSYALFPFLSVAENVAYPLRIRSVPAEERRRRVQAALATVQLDGYGDRRITQLSGGQRQRVALARAMVFKPQIILMDEPLSALDKKLREHMQIELKALHRQLRATIVYVTHDQREALTMSDRIAVLNRGRIVQLDTPEALYRRPTSLFVADFVGESVTLPVDVSHGVAHVCGKPLHMAGPLPQGAGPFHLVIRPETLSLNGATAANRFAGHVRDVVYQGDTLLALVQIENGPDLAVRLPSHRADAPQQGAPVVLSLAAEDTIVVPEAAPDFSRMHS